ncbi:MAG: N-acetylneuraminate synthase family protein [Planctomycetes bacterium]|nr:N-acetylneuraminate synthase family protein [Planctomycetota bacterium]
MSTFVIAEIGPNHNGSLETALEMVRRLAGSGTNAIKFQLAQPEKVYSAEAFKADYQVRNDGAGSIVEMSRRIQLPREAHWRLLEECHALGILYLCTAFDIESLRFIDQQLDVPMFKVASGELMSIDILEYMAERDKPVLLSTGMSTYEEIESALTILKHRGLKDITLLHCVSNYPAPYKDINLRVISELVRRFGCKVGFSDHSLGSECCLAAVALGATVIEKHVTLDKNMLGPDHKASATIEEFAVLVALIRRVEAALGTSEKRFSNEEDDIRRMSRKSIVAIRTIVAGEIIGADDITFKRPGTGMSPMERDRVLGRRAVRDLAADHVIRAEDVDLS